ncbi:TIGR02594 family protein [Histophilus somni]|uniref:NlpC/P60 family protein n=1 Tax=Histophilus somni TaxID=731 RepID=UPI00201F7FA3|nr:TIGR02594 family protein [Histophilus somni]
MNNPTWLIEANKHQGLKEIQGEKHHPEILRWIKELGGWFSDDETPWCGTFVAHCLKTANKPYPKHWYRAKAYTEFGTKLHKPLYGCIAVFERQGGGHVGFVIGEDNQGNLLILGGNQNNQVNIRTFKKDRLLAYVWPEENPPMPCSLPILANGMNTDFSREEEEV